MKITNSIQHTNNKFNLTSEQIHNLSTPTSKKDTYSIEKFIATKTKLIDTLISNSNLNSMLIRTLEYISNLPSREKSQYIFSAEKNLSKKISNISENLYKKKITPQDFFRAIKPKHLFLKTCIDIINQEKNCCLNEEKILINNLFSTYCQERDETIIQNLPLAKNACLKHISPKESGVNADNLFNELLSTANFYLIQSIDNLLLDNFALSTYAVKCIDFQCKRTKIEHMVNRPIPNPIFRRRAKLFGEYLNNFYEKKHHAPDKENINQFLETIGVKDKNLFLREYDLFCTLKSGIQRIPDNYSRKIDDYQQTLLKEKNFIKKAIKILNPSQQEIINLLLNPDNSMNSFSLSDITKKMGLSKQRIYQLYDSAQERLKTLITAREKNLSPQKQTEIKRGIEEFLKTDLQTSEIKILTFHFGLHGTPSHSEEECCHLINNKRYNKKISTIRGKLFAIANKIDKAFQDGLCSINGEDFMSLSLKISYPDLFKDDI